MLKRAIPLLCLILCLPIFFGQARAQEKYSVDKVVAVVGNSAIFYSEVLETSNLIAENRRKYSGPTHRGTTDEALELLMIRKLLYNQALIDSVTINEDYLNQLVESEITQQVEAAGSINALEEREGRAVYDIRGWIKQQYSEELYANSMRRQVIQNVKVTPGEVERFYNKLNKEDLAIIPEQYVYAQITKYPGNTTGAKQRTRERLLEMRERIINGERFDMLARMYSTDPSTALRGGESDYLDINALQKPFADALVKLQPGQVSEVIETTDGFHIIEKLDQKGNVYKFRHIRLNPVFTEEELVEASHFLDSLAGQIRAGEITFAKAAQQYSDDKYSKENGGVVSTHESIEVEMERNINIAYEATEYSSTRFFREQLPVQDYYAISALKPGEVSDSYRSYDMRGNQLSKIVSIVEIVPSHPANINDDYTILERNALMSKQDEVFYKWLEGKIETMYIKVADEYRDTIFDNKGWLK